MKVSDSITLATIHSTLDYLVHRHDALRTTYHLDAGPEPQQRVNPPAAVPLVRVTTEQDGTATPTEVIGKLSKTEFDLAGEWPIRACVITTAGVPKQLVLVLNQLAFDAWSAEQLKREIAILSAEAAQNEATPHEPGVLEPIRHQPLDIAGYESSAEAAAVKERAAAYWAGELSTLPANTLGGPRGHGTEPAARGATVTSPAMLAASHRIAARHDVPPYLVHVAAYNMVMAAYTGGGTVAHLSFTGNRDKGPYTDTMTCMSSPLLVRVDCHDDPSFSEVLRRVVQRFAEAGEHSCLPYDEFAELVSRESSRRGQAMQIAAELHFSNQAFRTRRGTRTKFSWDPAPSEWARFGSDVYFRIHECQDAVAVTLNAVSTVMGAKSIEKFLRGYEAVLLAHQGPSADLPLRTVTRMLGFSAPARPAGRRVVRIGTDLVELDRVEALLERHPSVRLAQVSAVDSADTGDGGQARLVAHVLAERSATPAQLRVHFLGGMYDHGRVRCPDWFRIHHPTPGLNCTRPGCWDMLPAAVEGDGRDAEPHPATSRAEQTLAAVVRRVNGLDDVDLSASYTIAGGRAQRIPRVLALLRENGLTGVSLYEFASARPLRALAELLTPIGTTATDAQMRLSS